MERRIKVYYKVLLLFQLLNFIYSCKNNEQKGLVFTSIDSVENNKPLIIKTNDIKIDTLENGDIDLLNGIIPKFWSLIKGYKWVFNNEQNTIFLTEFRKGDIEKEASGWNQKVRIFQIVDKKIATPVTIFEDSIRNEFEFIDISKEQFIVFDINLDGFPEIFLNYVVVSTQGEDADLFKVFYKSRSSAHSFVRKIDQNNYAESIDSINLQNDTLQLAPYERLFFAEKVRNCLIALKNKLREAEE